MHSRLRSALLWLLLLALPLQGFAAAAMLHCGPNHHRMQAAATALADEAHRHAMMGHAMHDAGAMTANADEAGAPGNAPVHDLDKVSKLKCSACAACCTGAGMPAMALFVASLPPASPQATPLFAPRADFLPDGLDRPPRISLV